MVVQYSTVQYSTGAHLDVLGGEDGGADGLQLRVAGVARVGAVAGRLGAQPPPHRHTLPLRRRLLQVGILSILTSIIIKIFEKLHLIW